MASSARQGWDVHADVLRCTGEDALGEVIANLAQAKQRRAYVVSCETPVRVLSLLDVIAAAFPSP